MKIQTRFSRFLLGTICLLMIAIPAFYLVGWMIPSWNATQEEVNRTLPGDEIVTQPELSWNHAITIHATPEQIYPWLVQIGDTRAGFYSFTFIENLFQLVGKQSGWYTNADRIHPEWQNPPQGQGIIGDWMAIQDFRVDQYVLAGATPQFFGMQWTWLWDLQPIDQETTRLIVRHRFAFPQGMPKNLMITVLDAGYMMERGMLLGIQARAEGSVPPAYEEPLGIILWLTVLVAGVVAAVRFVRRPDSYAYLATGLVSVILLFIYTFIQPAIWLRAALDGILVVSLVIAGLPGKTRTSTDEKTTG